jgi:hypothetical protein
MWSPDVQGNLRKQVQWNEEERRHAEHPVRKPKLCGAQAFTWKFCHWQILGFDVKGERGDQDGHKRPGAVGSACSPSYLGG